MCKSRWMTGLLLFTFLLGFAFIDKAAAEETGVTVGKSIPLFNASDLNGQSVQVGMPGKPYVLNFWATWCPPCREELPELNQFAKQYSANVEFKAINIQESGDAVGAFLSNNGYDFPVLLDAEGNIARDFRIRSVPTTLVVDAQGVIRYRKTGTVTMAELENVLSGL
ncbi:TlpA disulfide reductase family protein [Azotosporobacter soli]|uniref:TlpA family protein disulfide reductase n=1 Tax=Azotosporobacter soli TaxID=3055040 RepID=UPI0031FF3139